MHESRSEIRDNGLGRKMDEHSEKFNRVRKYKEEPNRPESTITETKNTLERINSRFDDSEE